MSGYSRNKAPKETSRIFLKGSFKFYETDVGMKKYNTETISEEL
jgi:hypothetical protein